MQLKFYTSISMALLCAACASYTPDPISLDRDGTEWHAVSTRLCPPNSSLSQGSMRSIGLLLNPELNKVRLSYAADTEASQFAGLWEDPSLSVEGVRVLKENFNNNSIGPSLSIPVTGLPALAKQVAEKYNEADYWNVRALERSFLSDLDVLRYNILLIHTKLKLIRGRLNQVKEEKASIDRLYKLGEVELSDYQASCQRYNDTMKESQELENAHLTKRHELIAQLGLHPAVGAIELSGALPTGVPSLVRPPSVEQLLESPQLHSKLAAHGASETELRAEIRRQYPELTLGPSLTREEGNEKIGIGLELSLPIWNRNRLAIAKAFGARDLKHHDAIALWRKLQQDVSALNARQKLAAEHCRTEHERLLSLQETGKQQEELYKLGETSLPALADARNEIFQRRMSYLDCLGTLLEIQTKLQYLNPYYQP